MYLQNDPIGSFRYVNGRRVAVTCKHGLFVDDNGGVVATVWTPTPRAWDPRKLASIHCHSHVGSHPLHVAVDVSIS